MAGNWAKVGPSEAIHPRTPLRDSFGYLPNEYVASGRTTAIAVSPTCVTGNCRAWITPAGGGIWRTNDILAARPAWKYLGGPLGVNASGAVTIDRNDRRGNTIYVGTGEGNACGAARPARVSTGPPTAATPGSARWARQRWPAGVSVPS